MTKRERTRVWQGKYMGGLNGLRRFPKLRSKARSIAATMGVRAAIAFIEAVR